MPQNKQEDLTQYQRWPEEPLSEKSWPTLNRIFETIPHLVFIKDSEGRFLWANRAASEFYGAENSEMLIGKRDQDFNGDISQIQKFFADEMRVITTGLPLHVQKELNTDARGQRHWLSTVKVPVRNLDGTVYVAIISTIIDQLVSTQEQLETEQLIARNRADMARLAQKLSHKLGTRIFTLETLLSLSPNSESSEDLIAAIDDMKQLCTDFQRLSHTDRLSFEETTMVSILRRSLLLPRNQAIEISVNGRSWPEAAGTHEQWSLTADERMLGDVFSELLANTIRASHPHRPVAIQIKIESLKIPPTVVGNHTEAKDYLRIIFADNGPGIPQSIKLKIFDPFVSGTTTGTGLGLAIVKGIISAHGGTISESGVQGEGARFEILLPIIPPEQP